MYDCRAAIPAFNSGLADELNDIPSQLGTMRDENWQMAEELGSVWHRRRAGN